MNLTPTKMLFVLFVLTLLLAKGVAADAQSTNAPSAPARLDYPTFKLINDRNIFNPNRTARSAGRTETHRETRPTAHTESFALVGIMGYEKGRFAFFDSASSQYRKTVQPTETIGGFKVITITPNSVRLASGTNELEMPVGMQLSREEEGEWRLAARSEPAATSSSRSSYSRTASVPSVPPTAAAATGDAPTPPFPVIPPDGEIPGPPDGFPIPTVEPENAAAKTEIPAASADGESDVLKKLMQRREQELNR